MPAKPFAAFADPEVAAPLNVLFAFTATPFVLAKGGNRWLLGSAPSGSPRYGAASGARGLRFTAFTYLSRLRFTQVALRAAPETTPTLGLPDVAIFSVC